MKKFRTILCIMACALCSLLVLCGCKGSKGDGGVSAGEPSETVTVTTKVKYEGSADEGSNAVAVGEDYTLRAYDTDAYAFAFWELNGEPVSEDAEYTVTATADETYYAVFAPKADNQVLVNVVYERDEYAKMYYENVGIVGEGYQTKGGELNLVSNGELPVSWFGIRDNWLMSFEHDNRGPVYTLNAQKSLTVVVTFEQVCEIVVVDSPNCELSILEGDVLMNQDESLSIGMNVAEGYVADHWTVVWYPKPSAVQDGYNVDTRQEGVNWGKDSGYEMKIDSLCRRVEISLSVTNENLSNPYQVEIIKEKGVYGLSCTTYAPDHFLLGATYSGYYMEIYPSENAYVKDIYLATRSDEEEEYSKAVTLYYGAYAGGVIHIPDESKYCDYEDVVVRIELASKKTHALVNLISCNEEIVDPAPLPSDFYYAPSISTQSFVIKKGTLKEFYMDYANNLAAIYMAGYQFSYISDAEGNVISETVEFAYTPTKDTDLYIHYEKKPIADAYFDYHLADEGDGYEVRLSPMATLPSNTYRSEYQAELTIPSTYNGLPVVEIPDFGMSFYQVSGNGMRDTYGVTVYSTLVVPTSVKRIGSKVFANNNAVKIVFDETADFDGVYPDAFYSTQNAVKVKITKAQLEDLVQNLHEIYIGPGEHFEVHFELGSHFESAGTLGHYESGEEYICVLEKGLDFDNFTTYDFSKLYHEFAHHYQIVSSYYYCDENYDTILIKPTVQEINAWVKEYGKEDFEDYWQHPMEVSARAFAKEWTGYDQG